MKESSDKNLRPPAVLLVAVSFLCLAFIQALAATAYPASDTLIVLRTTAPLEIDGRLDEADWTACETITLSDYQTGDTPLYATVCRALWDDTYLYLSWQCTDPDIWGTYTARDDPLYNEEVVEAFINPDSVREDYLEIEVSPLGTLWDGKILIETNGRSADISWNPEIVHAVRVSGTVGDDADVDSGWTVEMAFPLSEAVTSAHIPPRDGNSWRLNFYRVELPGRSSSEAEFTAWSPIGGNTFHDPDSFGEIVFSTRPVRFQPGDTNGDLQVNIFDLLNLLRALRDPAISEGNPAYDVDSGGTVDIFDVLALLKLF